MGTSSHIQIFEPCKTNNSLIICHSDTSLCAIVKQAMFLQKKAQMLSDLKVICGLLPIKCGEAWTPQNTNTLFFHLSF